MGVAAAADAGEYRDTTLTIARPEDVRDLNPLRQANNSTSEVTYQMHEGLVTLSPDEVITPVLATDGAFEDGLTYRLTLREGVNFHSGAPFDAEAVKWNFEKQLKADPPGIAAGLLPSYSAINVVDDYTIDITLEEPNGVFPNILGAPLLMMVDLHATRSLARTTTPTRVAPVHSGSSAGHPASESSSRPTPTIGMPRTGPASGSSISRSSRNPQRGSSRSRTGKWTWSSPCPRKKSPTWPAPMASRSSTSDHARRLHRTRHP